MASVLSLRCNRKRQTNVFASPARPAQTEQREKTHSNVRDKWWQYQASVPGKGTLYMTTALRPGFNLRRRHVVLVLSSTMVPLRVCVCVCVTNLRWRSPATNLTVYMPSCGSGGISLCLNTKISSCSSSTWELLHPSQTAAELRGHIDLLGVSNHWGSSCPPPPSLPSLSSLLVVFAEQWDESASTRLFIYFLFLIDVDLIKILAFRMTTHQTVNTLENTHCPPYIYSHTFTHIHTLVWHTLVSHKSACAPDMPNLFPFIQD